LIGTLRSNRVKLPEVTKAITKRGETVGRENLEGIVAKWRDNRDVTIMFSNRHIIDTVDTEKKNKKEQI